MTIKQFFEQTDLNDSFVVGYYGGGNFGDELLLEVLLNLFANKRTKNLTVFYSKPELYKKFHKDFGYKIAGSKVEVLKGMLKSKNIIVGGGGIWGLDFNLNNFILSLLLLFLSFLGKKVYLLGVGHYKSTTPLGRVGAWLAAKASSLIIARDIETFELFRAKNRNTLLDRDIVFYISDIDLKQYEDEVQRHFQPLVFPTNLLGVRRFQDKYRNDYSEVLGSVLAQEDKRHFLLMMFEPKEVDPGNYDWIRTMSLHKNVRVMDMSFNPVIFYLFLKQNKDRLKVAAPQFHVQLVCHLAGVEYLPLSYDNKVQELFRSLGITTFYPIGSLKKEVFKDYLI